jgi:nitrite reductase/ring-hydroxylating ferredoxin subunit
MESKQTGPPSEITRRTFFGQALLSSVAVGLVTISPEPETSGQVPPLAYPPKKIEGAEQLLPGLCLYFSYPAVSDPAVLYRAPDGEFAAYSRKCAHLGCSVEFEAVRRCLKCPCHQGAYDPRTGYVLFGPPPRALDQIVLHMRAGGEVWAVGKRFGSNRSECVAAETPKCLPKSRV